MKRFIVTDRTRSRRDGEYWQVIDNSARSVSNAEDMSIAGDLAVTDRWEFVTPSRREPVSPAQVLQALMYALSRPDQFEVTTANFPAPGTRS